MFQESWEAADSGSAKKEKTLPGKGQFDLEGVYSDFVPPPPFLKALFNFAWLSGEKKNTTYLVLFTQDVNALANKTSNAFNQSFEKLPILKPSQYELIRNIKIQS